MQTRNIILSRGLTDDEIKLMQRMAQRSDDRSPRPAEVAALRELLEKTPELWQQLGDLAAIAREHLIEYAGPEVAVRESVRLAAEALRRELALPGDSALERIAVEECVAAYLLHYNIQAKYACVHQGEVSRDTSDFWEKRLTLSQRRYLRAVEALARLRRLALPLLQINIAEHQNNLAANVTASRTPPPDVTDADAHPSPALPRRAKDHRADSNLM